ncbi:antitoxin MazE6 [Nocardioides baekrokdamisoli]|uniref:Antitoxin MazE6 n=1 Tax=Nocardioides baekrokdamisoli TaxID=1804624 RepID=A0A3G9J3E9_9ACTN|nr:ribbon-helix-helix protein, CopG family [Nocardioides baekrokdamisoli]BBH18158.1 antitoxin MazE6 [Nocardioides baekrokdamisoli]
MKTAISVPDEIFERVERMAKRHGINRSQFYSQAAERYASELEANDLKDAINAAVDIAYPDMSVDFALETGRRLLGADDEW